MVRYHSGPPKVNNNRGGKMIKVCKICGKEFEPIKYGGKRIYCYECSPRGSIASQITSIRHSLKKLVLKDWEENVNTVERTKFIYLIFITEIQAKKKENYLIFQKGIMLNSFFLKLINVICYVQIAIENFII